MVILGVKHSFPVTVTRGAEEVRTGELGKNETVLWTLRSQVGTRTSFKTYQVTIMVEGNGLGVDRISVEITRCLTHNDFSKVLFRSLLDSEHPEGEMIHCRFTPKIINASTKEERVKMVIAGALYALFGSPAEAMWGQRELEARASLEAFRPIVAPREVAAAAAACGGGARGAVAEGGGEGAEELEPLPLGSAESASVVRVVPPQAEEVQDAQLRATILAALALLRQRPAETSRD